MNWAERLQLRFRGTITSYSYILIKYFIRIWLVCWAFGEKREKNKYKFALFNVQYIVFTCAILLSIVWYVSLTHVKQEEKNETKQMKRNETNKKISTRFISRNSFNTIVVMRWFSILLLLLYNFIICYLLICRFVFAAPAIAVVVVSVIFANSVVVVYSVFCAFGFNNNSCDQWSF